MNSNDIDIKRTEYFNALHNEFLIHTKLRFAEHIYNNGWSYVKLIAIIVVLIIFISFYLGRKYERELIQYNPNQLTNNTNTISPFVNNNRLNNNEGYYNNNKNYYPTKNNYLGYSY